MKHFHKKIFKLLLGIILLFPATLEAQPSKPVKALAFYDTSAVAELFHKVAIGFTFIYPDGAQISTRGLLQGEMKWNKFSVHTPQGEVRNGQLTFDPAKVWENGHKATFQIKIADTTLISELPLPYVKQIRFNLYTDSLKRDVPFYLNVEGHFSSGRIYPLDAKNLQFEASGGTLNKNILLVKKSDTAIHEVKVYTQLKLEPALNDSAVIPVKIIQDTADLPTEEELLRQWKRQRRKH